MMTESKISFSEAVGANYLKFFVTKLILEGASNPKDDANRRGFNDAFISTKDLCRIARGEKAVFTIDATLVEETIYPTAILSDPFTSSSLYLANLYSKDRHQKLEYQFIFPDDVIENIRLGISSLMIKMLRDYELRQQEESIWSKTLNFIPRVFCKKYSDHREIMKTIKALNVRFLPMDHVFDSISIDPAYPSEFKIIELFDIDNLYLAKIPTAIRLDLEKSQPDFNNYMIEKVDNLKLSGFDYKENFNAFSKSYNFHSKAYNENFYISTHRFKSNDFRKSADHPIEKFGDKYLFESKESAMKAIEISKTKMKKVYDRIPESF